eukprot:TRINITY_DN7984_c1_g1_i2.p1 TRINITY_DN7984_c1_g1~~TRINITY_DN7984_c1_g1_i2.p1  ORF type:complete len:204 (-),score=19.29 TRINITY_DN7984_c1_g1_i2:24-635(-)
MVYYLLIGISFIAILYAIRRFLVNQSYYRIDPNGRAFLITGAASGLGKSAALKLLNRGAFVFACDLNEDALQSIFKNQKNVRIIKLNVTKQEDVDAAVQVVEKEGRGLFGIINSAGIAFAPGQDIFKPQSVGEGNVDAKIRPILEVNTLGTMRINAAFIHLILESKGTIVNLASVAGILAPPMLGAYAASKHGSIFAISFHHE